MQIKGEINEKQGTFYKSSDSLIRNTRSQILSTASDWAELLKEYDLLKRFADEMVYEMNYVSSYYAEQKDYEKLQSLNSIFRGVHLSSSINLEIATKGARNMGEVHWLSMPFVHELGVFSKAL